MTDVELELCRHDGGLLFAIIARKVTLKREGREWKGLRPFHTEKTPSFTVFPDGHYHCFGCSAHGTAFDFIMATERVDFPAAVSRVEAENGATSWKLKKPSNGQHHGDVWQPIMPRPADAPKPTDKSWSRARRRPTPRNGCFPIMSPCRGWVGRTPMLMPIYRRSSAAT